MPYEAVFRWRQEVFSPRPGTLVTFDPPLSREEGDRLVAALEAEMERDEVEERERMDIEEREEELSR